MNAGGAAARQNIKPLRSAFVALRSTSKLEPSANEPHARAAAVLKKTSCHRPRTANTAVATHRPAKETQNQNPRLTSSMRTLRRCRFAPTKAIANMTAMQMPVEIIIASPQQQSLLIGGRKSLT